MPLPTETGSKKHIVAEGYFETEINPALSQLFITDYTDFRVLSLYSDLSMQFLAYKVIHRHAGNEDFWLSTAFAKSIQADFNPDFELIPAVFDYPLANQLSAKAGFTVNPASEKGYLHIAYGLSLFNAGRKDADNLYVFRSGSVYTIFAFREKVCLLANAFQCKSEDEVLYFILNAMHICELEPNRTSVYIDYNTAADTSLKSYLKPYFRPLLHMKPDMENPDAEIPFLPELLFSNYLLSLCV